MNVKFYDSMQQRTIMRGQIYCDSLYRSFHYIFKTPVDSNHLFGFKLKRLILHFLKNRNLQTMEAIQRFGYLRTQVDIFVVGVTLLPAACYHQTVSYASHPLF